MYIHIEQENLISHSDGETNSIIFSQLFKDLFIHNEGTISWLAHEYGLVESIIHLIFVLGFTKRVFGLYQLLSCIIFISWTSFEVVIFCWVFVKGNQSVKRFDAFDILNIHNIRTITPTNLKNFCASLHFINETSHPTHKSHGAVPSAKSINVIHHTKKLFELIAYTCIASVKPQGRKKLIAQLINADSLGGHEVWWLEYFHKNFGNVIENVFNLGDNSDKLIHNIIITIHTARVNNPKNQLEILMKDPKTHNNPPRNQNPRTLHRLKKRCGSNLYHVDCFMWSWFHFVLTHKISQPTNAIQLENQAVIQTKKATEYEGVPSEKAEEKSNQNIKAIR